LVKFQLLLREVFWDGAHLTELTNGLKEFIRGAGELRLEEGEPENLSVNTYLEESCDLSF